MKKIKNVLILTILTLAFSNAYALGYVSRDCPQVGSKESFTMSWLDSQWLYTFSVALKKKNSSPYYTYDVRNSGATWKKETRSAADIIFKYSGDGDNWYDPESWANMSDYWAGVYGVHYWFNLDAMQSERRVKYIAQSCDMLTWGVDNWG